MGLFLQQFANGLMSGCLYGLIALGLTLVYGVMKLSNFAHGEFAMLGGYATFFSLTALGNNYLLALVMAMLTGIVSGLVINLIAFYPLVKGNPINMMISSLGVSTLVINLAQYFFTANPRVVQTSFNAKIFRLGPISVTGQRLLVSVVALVLSLGVYLIIKRSKFGIAIRATSSDDVTAMLYGMNTRRIAFVTFILGTTLTAVAGGLMAPLFNVYPSMGLTLTTKSFVVVVLGGMGSVPGAILGGLIIGLVESFGSLISTKYVDLFVYLILFIVLVLKPQGIFSLYRREKV